MRKLLFFISLFLWTCGGGDSSPTGPEVPLAYNLSLTTNEDTVLTFTFEDISSSSNISFQRTPRNGLLTISGDSGTYTPNENWFGTDTFQYIVTNTNGLNSNVGYGQINVTPVNDAPSVPEESILIYQIEEGYPTITISLEGEDIDSEELTFIMQTNPTYGEVSIEENVASYNTNVDNFDSFKYQVCDEQGACSLSREVVLNIDWDEIKFDVPGMGEDENGNYVYHDSNYTWVLSNDGATKESFTSNYGFLSIDLVKVADGFLSFDENQIRKLNFNLDGNVYWNYSPSTTNSTVIKNIAVNDEGDIFFGHGEFPYDAIHYGILNGNGNELLFDKMKYNFSLGPDLEIRGEKLFVSVNDNYMYGIMRSYFRYEEKQFQTFAGQTSFAMVEDENQKYDLFVEHANYPINPILDNRVNVKIDISGSEALGPDIQDSDINKTHYIDKDIFNDGSNDGSNVDSDGNRYKLIDTNFDTDVNNGNGGSNTVINSSWIEYGSPQHYIAVLVKTDFDGNILQVSDLEDIESYVNRNSFFVDGILAFNDSGPIIYLEGAIYKFSEDLINVEWIKYVSTLPSDEGVSEIRLAKINENEFVYSENNKLYKVDINDGSIIWEVELYDQSFAEAAGHTTMYLFTDSEDSILVQGYNDHIMKFDINGNKIF